ncbi:hypothetical protein C8J56DRAFT_1058092 [Mycena floridula]|nr:hypothetical protein C8J56DRAFT_1058092 [Mycena floridula]
MELGATVSIPLILHLSFAIPKNPRVFWAVLNLWHAIAASRLKHEAPHVLAPTPSAVPCVPTAFPTLSWPLLPSKVQFLSRHRYNPPNSSAPSQAMRRK